jgi:hypothetical protein
MQSLNSIPRAVSSLLVFLLCGTMRVGTCATTAPTSSSSDGGEFASASVRPVRPQPLLAPEPARLSPALFSPTDLFEKARESADRMDKELAQFICQEQIERSKGSIGSEHSRKVDVITLQVSYDSGEEHYTDILQNSKRLDRIGAVKGAWSEGEYGTFLREAANIFRSKPLRFLSMGAIDGQPAAAYAFDLSADESPWDMQVSGKHYILPFHGQLWVSPTTGNILQIDRISTSANPAIGISGVNWSVTFGEVQVDGKRCWLPTKAIYSVTYLGSDRHEWNKIAFSGYRRYGSEVTVHFE